MKKIIIFYFLLFSYLELSAQFGGSQGGNRPPGGVSNGNNATLPPGGPNVIMYQNMKYSGMSRALGEGAFSGNNLGFLGNNVSSIYIPPGKVATVRDSRGQVRTFSVSVSNLAQYGWDNKIASGVIQRSGPGSGSGSGGSHGGNGVIPVRPPVQPPVRAVARIFTDSEFRGQVIQLGQGRTRSLGAYGDRAASSIQVAPGYAIRVFTGVNCTGHYQTFSGSVVNLSPYGWNDKIRSVEIRRL